MSEAWALSLTTPALGRAWSDSFKWRDKFAGSSPRGPRQNVGNYNDKYLTCPNRQPYFSN
jgi:hypothetical protein